MPSFPVHLVVAHMLADRIGVKSREDFFLGCIAPDSVNLNGFASQQERYGAHIRSVDYEIWKKQLTQFYADNRQKFAERADYLKGYLFHCITDIAWDEAVQPLLFEYLQSGGELSRDQITKLKWEELFRFNSLIVTRDDFTEAITSLTKAQPLDIATVTGQLIAQYREYAVCDYKDKIADEPPKFLCTEHIDICADRTLQLYEQLIEK